jgi:hypothetical protein
MKAEGSEPPARTLLTALTHSWRSTSPRVVLAVMVGMGLVLAAVNDDLPILRNSLLYAQISEHLSAHGMRPWQVCANPELAYNKACGFPVFAAPLVAVFGLNEGLVWASFVGTLLFFVAAWAFFRQFRERMGLSTADIRTALLFCCFNPLTFYQFWSAYPDTLFNAGFVFSFVLLDRVLSGRFGWQTIAAYLAVTTGCMVVKHGAVLLVPLHLFYLWWERQGLAKLWRTRRNTILLLAASMLLAATFFLLGRLGMNPLLNLVTNKDQLDTPLNYSLNMKEVAVFLLICLGPLCLLLPRIRLTSQDSVLFAILLATIHSYSVYGGSDYNARYYVGCLPFLAIYLTRAYRQVQNAVVRRTIAVSFAAISAVSILVFNERHVFRFVSNRLPIRPEPATALENLRIAQHLDVADSIRTANRLIPPGGRMFYVSIYYGTGGFGVYEHAGLFRPDIAITHTSSISEAPLEPGWSHVRPAETRGAFLFLAWAPEPKDMTNTERVAAFLYRVK